MSNYRIECYKGSKMVKVVDITANNEKEAKIKADSIARNCDAYNLIKPISEDYKSCAYIIHLKKPKQEASLF